MTADVKREFKRLFLSLAFAWAVSGQTTPNPLPSQIFSRSKSSVVVIVASGENQRALGSGFIVGDDKVVTNHHVVEGMTEAFVVFSDGKVQPVSEVIAASAEQDLIILRVQTGHRPPLPLGDELSLNEGDPVYAIGAPKGLELSFTNGIVSSFRKSSSQFLIQTTVPIAPGSSGGPLLDKSGLVVGITTSMVKDAPGIYFSIGSGDVRRLMRTPYGVALTFADWAKQRESKPTDTTSGTPTLEETLAWMSDFAKRYAKVTGTSSTAQYFGSFEQAQGCDVRILHLMKSPTSNPVRGVDEFSLRDIDPTQIFVSASFDVNLFTLRNAPLIHRVGIRPAELYMDFLPFDSKENAERFATALKHAVTLCRDVKEPF